MTVLQTLPRDVAAFTGREDELEHLTRATGAGEAIAIHTVDGMPGVGKTTLAIRAANLLAPRFPDGQLFIRLHAHTDGQLPTDPADVLAALLASRGILPELIPRSLEERAAMWRDHAAGKKILLVLDDAADNAQIEPLLPGVPGCLVLVTSRRRLVALDGASPLPLRVLRPDAATQLFSRLAHRTPTPADASAVTRAVLLCGHLPLAIALLAGRLAHHPTWSIPAFTDEFAAAQNRLGELEAGDRAVRTAFDLSYNDLPPTRQRLFRRLGLHPGTDTDAYAAAALDNIPLHQARLELRALYTDHLIDEPVPGRYRLHDLLRAYTQTLTAQDPLQDRNATIRLLNYYQHTAHTAGLHITRTPRPGPTTKPAAPAASPDLKSRSRALSWLRTERSNLTACVQYAALQQLHTLSITLTAALTPLHRHDGPWDDTLLALHRTAISTAEHHATPSEYALALWDLGDLHLAQGDFPQAAQVLGQALTRYRALGNRLGEANTLQCLGYLHHVQGDVPQAAHLISQALAHYRAVGNQLGEADTLQGLGYLRRVQGDFPGASQLLDQALTRFRTLGNGLGEANTLQDLGRLHLAQGDLTQAAQVLDQALAINRVIGARHGEAKDLQLLGSVQHASHKHEAAAFLLRQAAVLLKSLGDRHGVAETLNLTGSLLIDMKRPQDALDTYREALDIARTISASLDEAHALEGAARSHLALGAPGQALLLLRDAETLYRDLNRVPEVDLGL
ncbi:tetratricopeptide repeat protein [Streptomyces filamentosus]|uniref:ATP-binding protein n=1 Tax=Streptomyces filamentosus TaxID=67294 RepID=UPI0033EF86BC